MSILLILLLSLLGVFGVLGNEEGQRRFTKETSTLEELTFPEERFSNNGRLSTVLRIAPFTFENHLMKLQTRAYEGSIPGPTLRVRRGDVLYVVLMNQLGPDNPEGLNMSDYHNVLSLPNTTNLHTHGLHVSGESPEDDVLVQVFPGESKIYDIHVPSDHAGGTFWYHPHRHGSTFLQVSGGAAGMIFVEDEEGDVPEEIALLKEVPIIFQHIKTTGSTTTQSIADTTTPKDELWQQTLYDYVPGVNDNDYNYILVNGHVLPKRSMIIGEWQRFRFVFAGHSQYLRFTIDLNMCEMKLLSKDGIYVADAPRKITYVHLAPGSRADVAIRCNEEGDYVLKSVGTTPSTSATSEWVGTIMTLSVSEDVPENQKNYKGRRINGPLKQFKAFRPHYLTDTSTLPQSEVDTNFTLTISGAGLNGQPFTAPPFYLLTTEIGQLHQWFISGVNIHPIHIHINPFQLVGPASLDDGDYFKIGDFHDTFNNRDLTGGSVTVRFQTDVYTGPMVFHCHILNHEDSGMMGIAQILGTEGTRWELPSGQEPSEIPKEIPEAEEPEIPELEPEIPKEGEEYTMNIWGVEMNEQQIKMAFLGLGSILIIVLSCVFSLWRNSQKIYEIKKLGA